MGNFRYALDCYHKASFLKNEDPLIEELVQRALQDQNEYSSAAVNSFFLE
jgi:hypothetical protein